MPVRIQRLRTKGWRMPEGALYVGRPTLWGNPFVGVPALAVDAYRAMIGPGPCSISCGPDTVQFARNAHPNTLHWAWRQWAREHMHTLRGKDLACWCGLDEPCHADVLLELANR
jgi:hypothetical protein